MYVSFSAILVLGVGGIKYFGIAEDWREEKRKYWQGEVEKNKAQAKVGGEETPKVSWQTFAFALLAGGTLGLTGAYFAAPILRRRAQRANPAVDAVIRYLETGGLSKVQPPKDISGTFTKNGAQMSFFSSCEEHPTFQVTAHASRDTQNDLWKVNPATVRVKDGKGFRIVIDQRR